MFQISIFYTFEYNNVIELVVHIYIKTLISLVVNRTVNFIYYIHTVFCAISDRLNNVFKKRPIRMFLIPYLFDCCRRVSAIFFFFMYILYSQLFIFWTPLTRTFWLNFLKFLLTSFVTLLYYFKYYLTHVGYIIYHSRVTTFCSEIRASSFLGYLYMKSFFLFS